MEERGEERRDVDSKGEGDGRGRNGMEENGRQVRARGEGKAVEWMGLRGREGRGTIGYERQG